MIEAVMQLGLLHIFKLVEMLSTYILNKANNTLFIAYCIYCLLYLLFT